LGIGSSKEYRQDTVIVSLRTVSVSTGRILLEVLVTKTILSVGVSQDVFRFVANDTELVEVENGMTENESVNLALQAAIETAVLQTIHNGIDAKLWSIKK
jgi:curli production assembly/transport component CsgG